MGLCTMPSLLFWNLCLQDQDIMRVREGSFQLLALLGVFVHHLQGIGMACVHVATC